MKADKTKQDVYKGAIYVPTEDMKRGANELRVVHEKVTDAGVELVEMMLHDGCNPTEAAKRME